MGLFDRIFGSRKDAAGRGPETSEFRDDETTTETSASNAPRRDLVLVVLRDTMRKHGIPSDWIECRLLSVTSATQGDGLHVQLVVHQGDERLLTYVHAFQESFVRELERFEPKALEWLFSLSWQFEGRPVVKAMPDPSTWGGAKAEAAAPAPAAPARDAELEEDLKALFAIRDAALREPAGPREQPDFEPTRPGFAEDEQPLGKSRR